jgi:hypothetical protein
MSQRIWVTVKPRAKTEGLTLLADGSYQASVHAPAQDGKANAALIALLSRHFSLPKSRIEILRGATARKKLIQLD